MMNSKAFLSSDTNKNNKIKNTQHYKIKNSEFEKHTIASRISSS